MTLLIGGAPCLAQMRKMVYKVSRDAVMADRQDQAVHQAIPPHHIGFLKGDPEAEPLYACGPVSRLLDQHSEPGDHSNDTLGTELPRSV